MTAASSAARNGSPRTCVWLSTSTRYFAAQQQRELAEVHLGADDPVVAAPGPRRGRPGIGLRWRRWICATERPERADPPAGGADRAVGRAPADDGDPRVAVRVVDLGGRQARGDPVDLRLAGAGHEVVVGRVVGDVAGPVGLLQPADAVLQARGARHGPRPGQRLRVAQVGQELAVGARWARWRSSTGQVGQRRRRRDRATARRRWPGSRRTAG